MAQSIFVSLCIIITTKHYCLEEHSRLSVNQRRELTGNVVENLPEKGPCTIKKIPTILVFWRALRSRYILK